MLVAKFQILMWQQMRKLIVLETAKPFYIDNRSCCSFRSFSLSRRQRKLAIAINLLLFHFMPNPVSCNCNSEGFSVGGGNFS